jgi:hypothetical protein
MSLFEPTKKLDLRQLPFDVLSQFVATILSTMQDSRRTVAGELSALRQPERFPDAEMLQDAIRDEVANSGS